MSKGFQTAGKKVLYLLYKKTNRKLWEFSDGRGKLGKNAAKQILRRLRKKGLVDMTEYISGNIYYLTDEGKQIAKPIVDEVDEYKKW